MTVRACQASNRLLEVDDIQSVKHEESTMLCRLLSCPTDFWNAQLTTLLLVRQRNNGQIVEQLNGSGTTST